MSCCSPNGIRGDMSAQDEKGTRQALQEVVKALEGLSPDGRRRVLDAAAIFFGSAPATEKGVVNTAEATDKIAQTTLSKPLSINEFLDEAKPSTNPQRIAAFAFFREQHEGNSRFARSDLKTYFAKAKEGEPANYDRDFS